MSNYKKSRSEQFLEKRGAVPQIDSGLMSSNISRNSTHMSQGIPQVSALMAKSISEYRRDTLTDEVRQGAFRDGTGPAFNEDGITSNAIVTSSIGFTKNAQVVSGGGNGGGYRGGNGDSVKQTPEVYSPLWLNSNLNLPRDRPTINAWNRSFYALNPFVHNAINLHSTYPISKLNIKCPNKNIEKFFNDMIEEIDLMNICVQIAQEFWLLGETFVYAELDESKGKWSRLLIQNPDYMLVKRTVVASEPIIMLRPDENLKKIIFSNKPSDIEQRKQLNQHIIDSVKHGENIPLDNFHVSHLARRISPYEIRGTGLPVCIFRQLMLFDKLRECYSADSEVLTDKGFKKITDLVYKTSNIELNSNYVNGVEVDENGQVSSILTMKEDFKVACVNKDTNEIEYHKPTELHMSKYTGKMLHFHGKKIDTLVSPNHKMWVSERHGNLYGDFKKVNASDIQKQKVYKLCGTAIWNGNDVSTANVCGVDIPIDNYLEFLGYVISEGCVDTGIVKSTGYSRGRIIISQLTSSINKISIRNSMVNFANFFGKNITEEVKVRGSGFSKHAPKESWTGTLSSKKITKFISSEIGFDGKCDSKHKRIPRWVLDLSVNKLKILLKSLLDGDGNIEVISDGYSYKYSTACLELANDIQELVIKCGYAPIISNRQRKTCIEYTVSWSDNIRGKNPIINNNSGATTIDEVDYNDVVWCFEVPTGLFITRRNGKFTILGNSKYAQADNMINPLTLVKIGSADFKPTFADLEAWRSVFECYDEETEVLTDNGFKKFNEVIDYNDSDETIINCKPKEGIKIACFNPDNEMLEYYEPDRATLYNYDGDMYHYKNNKIDVKVTPNHDMWVSHKEYQYNGHRESVWGDWHKVKAQDLSLNDYSRFKNDITWEGSEDIKSINVIGHDVPIELYLEYLGYVISEGCIFTDGIQYMVGIYQTTTKHYDKMRACSEAFGDIIRLKCNHGINKRSEKLDLNQKDVWSGRFYNQKLFEHFKNECGDSEGNVKSSNKRIPRWVLDLSPRLLTILLNALIDGDGFVYDNPKQQSKRFAYYTTSKQLADDVYELIYKCGYVPTSFVRNNDKYIDGRRLPLYTTLWSTTNNGKCPLVYKTSRNNQTKEKHNLLTIEKYNGKVWCFTVPTGLFITRRSGKIGIHGNSAQYDKDFKIFTHEGVAVERVGYGSGIYDISGDITQIIKEIYVGLQVPSVLMDGGADTTYANGGVALDVLRQRYMQFRNMMSTWLKRKIFAPISKIQGFYDYSDGEKQLIIPEIDWNHMSLFDAGDYISNLLTLTQGEGSQKRASLHTLYRSIGLEYEDEIRKMRREAIQNAINEKEKIALTTMSLNVLRTLGEEDEIPEPEVQPGQGQPGEASLPGEMPLGGAGGGGGLPGLDMGGLPPPPPLGGSGGPPETGGAPSEAGGALPPLG